MQPNPAAAVAGLLDGAEPGTITVAGLTVYGTIDIDLSYQSHGTPLNSYFPQGLEYAISKNSNRSIAALAPGALGHNLIGLKGDQLLSQIAGADVFAGWSTLFNVQIGFSPLTGTLADGLTSLTQNNGLAIQQQTSNGDSSRAGQEFNGEAYFGLANATWGEFRIGRNTGVLFDAITAYDPIGGSYAFSALGYSAILAGGTGSTESARINDSVKYKTAIGAVRFAAEYGFAGNGRGGDVYELGVGVDVPGALKGLSIDGGYAQKTGAIAASSLSAANCASLGLIPGGSCAANIVNATISDNTTFTILAKYGFGKVTAFVGFEEIHYANPSEPLTSGGALGGYNVYTYLNTAYTTDKVLDVTWAGLKCAIEPNLTLAAAWYHYDQDSYRTFAAAPGGKSKANIGCSTAGQGPATIQTNCAGSEDFLSMLIDYQLTKRLDLYAGAMWSKVDGGLAQGFLQTQTIDPTIGARFRF